MATVNVVVPEEIIMGEILPRLPMKSMVFLLILSGASEYDELPVRHNEENFNEALSKKVPYKVDPNSLDDPHVKANLLFQAHFSQLELPISDYITDLKSVLDQSIRIIRAMIDICANSGWLSSTITCMHLLQMVMQGLWYDRDSQLWMSQLWMLPHMTDDLVNLLHKNGISTIQELLVLPKKKLQSAVGSSTASSLYQDLQHFPSVQVNINIPRREPNSVRLPGLNVRMENTNHYNKSNRVFTPRFPKVEEEAWWLILGNTLTSELYAMKRVSFSNYLITHMELPSTMYTLKGMKLILVSDSYIGFEQEYSVEDLVGSQQLEAGN